MLASCHPAGAGARGGFLDGNPAGLFTIELPEGASFDPRYGSRIDWYLGDSNAEGGWLGADWSIHWEWWRDCRTERFSECRDGMLPTRRFEFKRLAVCALLNRRTKLDSLPDSSLVVYRGRRYRWQHQLLKITFAQLEPADSLAAERLLASVKFEPKKPWR